MIFEITHPIFLIFFFNERVHHRFTEQVLSLFLMFKLMKNRVNNSLNNCNHTHKDIFFMAHAIETLFKSCLFLLRYEKEIKFRPFNTKTILKKMQLLNS